MAYLTWSVDGLPRERSICLLDIEPAKGLAFGELVDIERLWVEQLGLWECYQLVLTMRVVANGQNTETTTETSEESLTRQCHSLVCIPSCPHEIANPVATGRIRSIYPILFLCMSAGAAVVICKKEEAPVGELNEVSKD